MGPIGATGAQGPTGNAGPAGPAGSGLGYALQAGSFANLNPADNTTYYFGCFASIAASTTAARTRCYVPKPGTITSVRVTFWNAGTLSSAQASTLNLRLNNTTDTVVSAAVVNNPVVTTFGDASLSVAVSEGDYFEIKWVTPTWSTNPTNVRMSVVVYIE